MRFLCVLCVSAVISPAADIVLPSGALERDRPVRALYRTSSQATGKGELSIHWTDVYGRVVEDRKIPLELTDETDIPFPLDLRRALAMKNDLHVHFSFVGVNKKNEPDRREEDAAIPFIARPPDREWWDYIVLMWQDFSADQFAVLKTLGINAGQWSGKAKMPPEFLLKNDLRWYAENIATDFYSEYHRWRPDRPVNWAFKEARRLHKQDPASLEPFKRHPSFSDPAWRKKIHDRLVESARTNSAYRPVFYSLGDESGVADLAAFWDFDFSDQALVEMREWLKERYGTLAALNRQWGTQFDSWDRVVPQTTDEAMKRGDDNFSSWADHKEFMDISYARALKMGVDAIHEVDPEAYVAIGGGQMPGWGGYDYARLSEALTAIEPYDIGNNIEILRSLNPRVAILTTAFARGPWEKHRIWYELLHGARGNIIWDDKSEHVARDGAVGPRGREVAPYYNELRAGVAALLINSERQADPIAIHYSQASMRADWMLAKRPQGPAWADRTSASEREDSAFLRRRESWCRLIEDLGLQFNFVAYNQLEHGELLRGGYRVFILPDSNSLSGAEAEAIREFVAQGGTLIADGEPGAFDEHNRRLAEPRLASLLGGAAFGRGKAIRLQADILNYHQQRLINKEAPVRDLVGGLLAESGVRPAFRIQDESGAAPVGIETHLFRNSGVTILALLSNPQLRVDELGPPEFKSNARFEKPRSLRVTLPAESYAYEVRTGRTLGRRSELRLTLDPYEPALFALSPAPLPELRIAAPARVARGGTGRIGVSFAPPSPAAVHVLHAEVSDPSGKLVPHYSGNLRAREGHAEMLLPMAHNDAPGKWTLRIKDLLSGQEQTATVEVF